MVGVLIKLTSMPALTFVTYRLWAGAAVFLAALAVTRRRLTWGTFRVCALGGVLFGADITLGFSALKLTAVANVAIIGALAPVLILLVAGRMFGERVGRREAALIGLSFGGIVVVALGSAGAPAWSPLGDALAGLSTLSWTAYWVFSKRARATVQALEYMTCVMLAGAVSLTPIALISGRSLALPRESDLLIMLLVVLIPGGMGHLLVAWSHQHVEAWLSALITQCVPVVAATAAWVALGEPLTPLVAVGGAVVVGATGLVILSTARRERTAREPETPVESTA